MDNLKLFLFVCRMEANEENAGEDEEVREEKVTYLFNSIITSLVEESFLF